MHNVTTWKAWLIYYSCYGHKLFRWTWTSNEAFDDPIEQVGGACKQDKDGLQSKAYGPEYSSDTNGKWYPKFGKARLRDSYHELAEQGIALLLKFASNRSIAWEEFGIAGDE